MAYIHIVCFIAQCLLLTDLLRLSNGIDIQVSSNFYVSPEVYSGYLSNAEQYKEAFTMPDADGENTLYIRGDDTEIEFQLATNETKGNTKHDFV